MYGIAFEWDRRKDSANRRKHGVGFAEATTVFDDPLSVTIPDPDDTAGDERFVIIGMSTERNLLIVVHTIRGERIRLISARPATKHERRNYEETSL
ncbi:MAG: BrnT family toxin [Bryobacteraceae bacterium]|jgi:uncharacterized DUF497 family protein